MMKKNSKIAGLHAEGKFRDKTSWESVASWYDDLLSGDDTYQTKVILPNLMRLVRPNGKKIIDIACGQGFFSRALMANGAEEVLGVDLSPELIKIADSQNNAGDKQAKKLTFRVAPAHALSFAEDESFDVAIIVLALQNIKEMGETIKEASRILKKGGELVIVLNHPCFRIPRASAWGFDEKALAADGKATGVQYRRVDKYGVPFSIKIDMTPGKNAGKDASAKKFTTSFHRPLQEYFKVLGSAGPSVVALEEWISHKQSQVGPRAEAEDRARKEFPMFLTLVAKK